MVLRRLFAAAAEGLNVAGGIDWLRWHHGSVTDPKFQLVARKAGCRLPDVLAVWAFVLEKASAADRRGTYGELDCEAVDCLFGLDEGLTQTDQLQRQGVDSVTAGRVGMVGGGINAAGLALIKQWEGCKLGRSGSPSVRTKPRLIASAVSVIASMNCVLPPA